VKSDFVKDVMVKERKVGAERYAFVMNFSTEPREIENLTLDKYDFAVKKFELDER
jgi:hypothetical protein